AFGTVTKRRIEIVVEGSLAERPADDADWREYGFKGKPGDVRAVPRQWAPYHLRLDWLMWFLPLGRMWEPWFEVFLARLLEGDAPTLRLLAHDPFDGSPPRWVRARAFHYRFTTHAEFRATGDRWVRTLEGEVIPPSALR
nr:lipase maturation factor family protein [Actinomycetota bacterium]